MTLAPEVEAALDADQTIDITTTGRKSGEARRLEIWFHRREGRTYITGLPGRRGWYANLVADPQLIFHLKDSLTADLPATARPITTEDERRDVFGWILADLGREAQFDTWMSDAPLVEVTFADA